MWYVFLSESIFIFEKIPVRTRRAAVLLDVQPVVAFFVVHCEDVVEGECGVAIGPAQIEASRIRILIGDGVNVVIAYKIQIHRLCIMIKKSGY